MIDYLTLDDVLALTARAGFTIADYGLVESALARPQASVFGEDAYPTDDPSEGGRSAAVPGHQSRSGRRQQTHRLGGDPALFTDPIHIPVNYDYIFAKDAQ